MIKQQLFFELSQWFLARSGRAGYGAWLALRAENDQLRASYNKHEERRGTAMTELQEKLATHQTLMADLALVDGFLSQKQYDEAQKFLRVALIKARRRGTDYAAQISAQAAQQNMGLQQGYGAGPLGGLGQALGFFHP